MVEKRPRPKLMNEAASGFPGAVLFLGGGYWAGEREGGPILNRPRIANPPHMDGGRQRLDCDSVARG